MRALLSALAALVLSLSLLSPGAPAQAAGSDLDDPAASTSTSTSTVLRRTAFPRVTRALSIAKNQIGDPYRYGAAGPNAFDCSGLVYYATHQAGLGGVPRTSSAQSRYMRRISRAAMRPGDFMFVTSGSGVSHVGIFVGRSGGRAIMLHAPYSGTRVRRDPVWTRSWFAGTLRGR